MGQTTKIDWADASWNPVTGCLHGCEYCYARGIARRFGSHMIEIMNPPSMGKTEGAVERNTLHTHELDEPMRRTWDVGDGVMRVGSKSPYPFDFEPTLHRYKLDEPQHWKKPRTIFVCSMADLFGNGWLPRGANGKCYQCNRAPAIEGKKLCQECYDKKIATLRAVAAMRKNP